MTPRPLGFSLALLLSFAALAHAQGTTVVADRRPAVIADIVTAAREAAKLNVPTPFVRQLGFGNRQRIAAYLMAANAERAAYAALLQALEAARLDKQVEAPPNSTGGTSLVMKGLTPRILGLAVERGALTREMSGTTVTFRVSPVGVAKALQGSGLVDLNDDYARSTIQRYSGRISVAATFDVSRGSEPGVFTGNDQQLASWAARYTVLNRRDPASPAYAAQWASLLSAETAPYRASVGSLNDALGRWPEYVKWEMALLANVTAFVEKPFAMSGNVDAAATAFESQLGGDLKKLEALTLPADVRSALDAYASELTKVQVSIDKIYAFAGRGPLATFDWTTTRDVGVPDLYAATGVFEAGLGASRKTDFTFNGGLSFYKSKPTGVDHLLKSVVFAAQLEHPLGKALAAPTLTFAARYSYLPNDTVGSTGLPTGATGAVTSAAASVAPVPKGLVAFFQAKLTVPIKDSGAKVPISVTASNRTELIKEKDVRGSIGITFDLDTFMSALTGLRR